MNVKMLNCIQSTHNSKGYITKIGFNLENVIFHINNLAWGILLCVLLSITANVSFYMLLSLTGFFHVLGTGLYKYKVPYMDIKKVSLSDFKGIDLSIIETETILTAQKKGLRYKEFFKNTHYVSAGFFIV